MIKGFSLVFDNDKAAVVLYRPIPGLSCERFEELKQNEKHWNGKFDEFKS